MTEDKRIARTEETSIDWTTLEKVVIGGDLSQLTPQDRVSYYKTVCESVGLNPATSPFEYIKLSGKLTLYPKRDATDQLRRIHRVSVTIVDRQRLEDVYIVTARATTPDGRTDESTGVVNIGNLKGDNLANALMKAETKAKRRVTLSICGLGMLDESEIETIKGAEVVNVEQAHSEQPASIPETASALDEYIPPEPQAMATRDQIKLISKLTTDAGYNSEDLQDIWLIPVYGVESRKELTKTQASELISYLRASVFSEKLKAVASIKALNNVAAEIKQAESDLHGKSIMRLREIYQEQHSKLSDPDEEREFDEAYEAAQQAELA